MQWEIYPGINERPLVLFGYAFRNKFHVFNLIHRRTLGSKYISERWGNMENYLRHIYPSLSDREIIEAVLHSSYENYYTKPETECLALMQQVMRDYISLHDLGDSSGAKKFKTLANARNFRGDLTRFVERAIKRQSMYSPMQPSDNDDDA